MLTSNSCFEIVPYNGAADKDIKCRFTKMKHIQEVSTLPNTLVYSFLN